MITAYSMDIGDIKMGKSVCGGATYRLILEGHLDIYIYIHHEYS
jgi:hypothetical protein